MRKTEKDIAAKESQKFVINGKGEKVIPPPKASRTKDDKTLTMSYPGTVFDHFGTCYRDLVEVNVSDLAVALGTSDKVSDDELKKYNAALAFIADNKPQDSIELLLLSQMFTVHNLSLEMSKRAIMKDQPGQFVEQNINRVNKLARTFTTQVEALNKHRSKGKQKITVQHVYVNKGGQAVVGDINQGVGNE